MTITLSNKSQLHFKKTGVGKQAILVIPGGPGLSLDYLEVFHQLFEPSEYTVYSYEPSGYPNSHKEFQGTIKGYAQELTEFINQLQLQDVILIGHSFGACIALEFLLIKNHKVKSAILISAFPSGKAIRDAIIHRVKAFSADFQELLNEFTQNQDPETYWQLIGNFWIPKHFYRSENMNVQLSRSLERYAEVNCSAYYLGNNLFDLNGAIMEWDIENRLSEIQIPCLIISAINDYFSMEQTVQFSDKLLKSKYWISEKGSHMVFYEDPENFKDAIFNFLE